MENMENWLRCNKCYRSMNKSKKKFSLTQCQHVFCSTCIVNVEKQCPECNAIGVKTVPLVNPLPQPLLHYFGNVKNAMQQCLEAARFQRTQTAICLRRYAEIQSKYEDMKRTYFHSAGQMKGLMAAYDQLKQKNAKIRADIAQLRSMESSRPATMEGPGFMRSSIDKRGHSNQLTMDHEMAGAHSLIGDTRNDARSSTRFNPSRGPIAAPSTDQLNRRPTHQHMAQNTHQNWTRSQVSERRYSPDIQDTTPHYPPRVVSSYTMPANRGAQRFDPRWIAKNRIPESLGTPSDFSPEIMNDSPNVIDNYPNYRRS